MNKRQRHCFILCLVGQPGSGKDMVANHLELSRNFRHISTGNIIREEMTKRGLPTDRENMRTFSRQMREEVGNMYPANIAAKRIIAAEKIVANTVISGPRNVAEIEFLKKKFGKNFILVAVDAPIKVRYERIKKGRGRTGDDISFVQFKAQEEAELNSKTHELSKLLSMADYTVDNSQSEVNTFRQVDEILRIKGRSVS